MMHVAGFETGFGDPVPGPLVSLVLAGGAWLANSRGGVEDGAEPWFSA